MPASSLRGGSGPAWITIDDQGVLYAFSIADPSVVRRVASVPTPDPNDSPTTGCDRAPEGGSGFLCIARRTNATVFRLSLCGGIGAIGSAGAPAGTAFRDLVTDPAAGQTFAIGDRPDGPTLFSVDNDTGQVAVVGDLFSVPSTAVVNGIGLAPDGTLYGVDRVGDRLLAIDRTTGAATEVGSLGVDIDTYVAFDFDETSGACYLIGIEAAGGFPRLYGCDTDTGALSQLATIGTAEPGSVIRFATGSVRDDPYVFADGFEGGDASAWSSAVP